VKWEGTRWAKEKYEKEHSIKIRDTTGDWVDPKLRQPTRNTQMFPTVQEEKIEPVQLYGDMEDMDDGDESDMEINSVDVELREAEQWLKDVAVAGDIPPHIFPLPDNNVTSHISTTSMRPRLPNDTLVSQWHQIPEFIQDHNSQSEQTNLVPVSGRSALSNISTTAPFNIQQRQPQSSNSGFYETNSTLLSLFHLQQRLQ